LFPPPFAHEERFAIHIKAQNHFRQRRISLRLSLLPEGFTPRPLSTTNNAS
jgi:hypothetical protein